MYILQPRSMIVIEAYYNNKLVGKFADMNTADRILKDMKKKVSYNFKAINDKNPDFWKLLKKGFILVGSSANNVSFFLTSNIIKTK